MLGYAEDAPCNDLVACDTKFVLSNKLKANFFDLDVEAIKKADPLFGVFFVATVAIMFWTRLFFLCCVVTFPTSVVLSFIESMNFFLTIKPLCNEEHSLLFVCPKVVAFNGPIST